MVRVHDLVELKDVEGFLSKETFPDWVYSVLREAPFVVVRRAPQMDGIIPVGIRGNHRSQRCASAINMTEMKQCFSPESIKVKEVKTSIDLINIGLIQIQNIMDDFPDLTWGPAGSVGFELVTSYPATHKNSDIDMVIRTNRILEQSVAQKIVELLNVLSINVDALLETNQGAFALAEYATNCEKLILRSSVGPKLVYHPAFQLQS
ncbi:phosphoribosyl-dephospho-CoA transferase [Alkalihalophilus pseudofirmus OF4]|uniref:Phosphoribosyl-dephospho-CoA transferase n=1 Tax=Alkalihalophilus pseudofirmus (strain ATCC BAA-2126 / JCM 17055 / OF4) TaxID=398511 RepID=D3FW19_ALKPO|nr:MULTISPECIES: malonate decarboxylase holo-ACP synthase [Alkalihalophilus]ADC50451.1 phosphoribosyl-dephospho-CoA transferase [Alkalihalophilus pseudofirmus OF4]MED1603197.1 malonate decarboxylase holo-ACP synthase [Alkalihalophilus marmarensis]